MIYFLIGFMGSGKSTIAKRISTEFNINHIDIDQEIEKIENNTISQIFENKGEDYFRNLEKNYINNIQHNDKIIISTGGGAPIFNNLMEIMNNIGKTIYIKCSIETLYQRLIKDHNRPLIKNVSKKNLKKYITNTLYERERIYKQAKYIIDIENEDPIKRIQEILR